MQVHGYLKVASLVDREFSRAEGCGYITPCYASPVREAKKMFGTLAFSSQSIVYTSLCFMLQWYKTLVRLHLQYCVWFSSPCYRKDIVKLKWVEISLTRMLPGIEGLSYRERLSSQ